MKLELEIRQNIFESEAHKLHVNLLYTAYWIRGKTDQILQPYDLSVEQFNVLRILKGAGNHAVNLKYLAERMLNKQSDASRLVDKLVEKTYVVRESSPNDRRQIELKISETGLEVVREASKLVSKMNVMFDWISDQKKIDFNDSLDRIREEYN